MSVWLMSKPIALHLNLNEKVNNNILITIFKKMTITRHIVQVFLLILFFLQYLQKALANATCHHICSLQIILLNVSFRQVVVSSSWRRTWVACNIITVKEGFLGFSEICCKICTIFCDKKKQHLPLCIRNVANFQEVSNP